MGQTNLQKIQESLVTLTQNSQIQQQQAENFIKDYIASGKQINDINNFLEYQSVDLFLKYFIKYAYKDRNHQVNDDKNGKRFIDIQAMKQNNVGVDNIEGELKHATKIIENWCNQVQAKVKRLITNLTEIYISNQFNKVVLRQKIKDLLISQMQIQSFRYYFYKQNVMKQTNSKILYLYDTSPQNPIYQYAYKKVKIFKQFQKPTYKQNSKKLQDDIQLQKLFDQLYPNTKHYFFQIYDKDKEIFHIFLLQINQQWKYGKCLQQSLVKKVLQKIILALLENLDSLYSSQVLIREISYKNYFSKSILVLIQQLVFLETHKINHMLEQIKINEKQKLISNFEKVLSTKETILTKIRGWRKKVQSQNQIQFFSFNQMKQLEFFFTNQEKVQCLKKIKNQFKYLDKFLTHYFSKNKNTIKKLLKHFQNGTKCQKIQIQKGKIVQITKSRIFHLNYSISFTFQPQILLQNKQNLQENQDEEKIIRKIKDEHPEVIDAGWFKLYLKQQSQNIKQLNTPRRKSHIKLQKLNKQFRISNFKNRFQIQQLNQNLNLENEKINLLQFSPRKLDIFVIKVFSKLNYFRNLPHEKDQFPNFLRQLHTDYQKHGNNFHNFIHAANGNLIYNSVMHTSYLFCRVKRNQQILSQLDKFAIVFSAIGHDVGHTGFTNLFQIARQSDIAILYNNKSPLENYHASRLFQILRKSSNNFLSQMPQNEFNYFRKLVISTILYTDIKEHFNLIKKFQSKKNKLQNQDISLLAGMIVHASDFGGSVKEFQLSKSWSLLVNQQFAKQYSQQQRLGLPQTPFMKDLDKLHILAKNQSGFLKLIVQPLYIQLSNFYQDNTLKQMVNNIEKNIKQWEKLIEQPKNKKQLK